MSGTTGSPSTVLLAAGPRPRLLHELGVSRPDAVLLLTETHPDALRQRLRALPRVTLVVDARRGRPHRQWQRWRSLFWYLAEGGRWVVVGPTEPPGRTGAELSRAVASTAVTTQGVVVTKAGTHLVKLRDAEAPAVLATRAPGLRVEALRSLPGGVLVPHPATSSHGHPDGDDLAAPLPYPPVHLRRYDGHLELVEGSVVRHGDTLLPDTYRWHLQDVPVNKRLVDVDEHVARTRRPEPVHEHLPGAYYHLDYKNPGHYGHLMTEAVSRLWGWHDAKRAEPGLKLLLRRTARHDHGRRRPELQLLPALGIREDDIAWMDHSVSVDHLVGVTPLWHNKTPYSAHPHVRSLWAQLRDGLPSVDTPPAERIFVTRATTGHRACRNLAEVEAFFAGHGFHVVMPGALSIPEQASLFAQARVVAGFGGTGLFNLAFARDLEQVVVLAHTAYDARNEQLMAAVHGVPAHYLWSEPDVAHPDGGWSYEAFQSSWRFDLDRHRDTLGRVLAR